MKPLSILHDIIKAMTPTKRQILSLIHCSNNNVPVDSYINFPTSGVRQMSPFPSTSNLQYCLAAHFTGNNNQSQLFHLSDRFNKNIQLKEALITSIHNAKKIEVYQSYHDPSTLLYSCGKEALKIFQISLIKREKRFFTI